MRILGPACQKMKGLISLCDAFSLENSKEISGAKYWLLDGRPYDNDCYWGARLEAYYFKE